MNIIIKWVRVSTRTCLQLLDMGCSHEGWLLASALSKGIIKREELPSSLVEALGDRLAAFD